MADGFHAGLFDELEALYPDSSGGAAQYGVAAAKGTVAGVHILLTGLTPGQPVSIEVSGPHTAFKLFELVPVPVEVNTGARLRTAYLHDDVNETLIRKAPFYIYEALKPLYNLLLPTGPAAALAFKTPIECCKARQAVEWRFTIAHAGEVRDLRFVVEQFPCRVPPASEHTHQYVNWISYANIAKWHNAPIGTPAYEAMLRKYLRAAVFSRQNILPIPLGSLFEREAGQPVLRTERLIRLIRLGEEVGLRLFEGSAFCSRSAGQADDDAFFRSLDMDAMHSPDEVAAAFRKAAFAAFDYGTGAKVSLTGEAVCTPAARETLACMAKQLFAFLQEHDLVSRWTQCLMDEPNDALAAAYREIAQTVKPLMPGVKILEPVLPTHALDGAVDIWCPSIDVYERDRAYYDGRVAQGDGLYVYTCLTPGGNYMNRMLDMQRLRQVLLFWMPAVYPNVQGFLHWGLNQYPAGVNPFERSSTMFSEQVLEFHPKRAMFLPAGDCCIFYPGYDEPLLSTRSEAHRLGLEDLCLLQTLPAGEARALAQTVARGYADYTKSIPVYRAAKLRLLEAAQNAKNNG